MPLFSISVSKIMVLYYPFVVAYSFNGLQAGCVVMRLQSGTQVKAKIGESNSELDRTIGVRQGSC